jgi:hypothetical protein
MVPTHQPVVFLRPGSARPAQLLGKSPRKSGILGRKAPETPKVHERNGGFCSEKSMENQL